MSDEKPQKRVKSAKKPAATRERETDAEATDAEAADAEAKAPEAKASTAKAPAAKGSGSKPRREAADKSAGVGRTVRLKVKRQDARDRPETRRWEEFEVPYLPQMNVHSALMQIQKDPRTASGQEVAPVVWEAACLEEVCGSCTMVINGRVRQACSTLIDDLAPEGQQIRVEPMTKFPVERDLIVDRSRMFESLKQVKAWIHLDGTHELGPGPRESARQQQERYPLSRCMTCGCCLEACPQYNDSSKFIGPAAINQVRLFNLHPSGAMDRVERLESLMGEGGITDCGKAQNCVDVCPKEIPLVDSIALVARDTTKHLLFGWLLK